MISFLDSVQGASNVYRTKDFIVCQKLSFIRLSARNLLIMSEDIYFLRSEKRDYEYEFIFKPRGSKIDGKRIHTASYTRIYVD